MDAVHGPLISTVRLDAEVVIRVRGDLDFAAVPRFVEAVESVLDDTTSDYLIDCKEVTFIDSEMIKAILSLRNRLHQSSQYLGLRNCSRPVERIVRLLGLEEELCRPSGSSNDVSRR